MSEILIRRPRPDDAAAMVGMMGDADVLAGLLQLPHATEAMWKKRIEEMPVGPTTAELFIVAERGGEVAPMPACTRWYMCAAATLRASAWRWQSMRKGRASAPR